MATWRGTGGADFHDFSSEGNSNDRGYGRGGNDEIWGFDGHDSLAGQAGDDQLHGESGRDILLGGIGRDKLWGGDDHDELWGGSGKDRLWGESGADWFVFRAGETGLYGSGNADTIHDFEKKDTIWLEGSYDYAGNTSVPNDGQYSIWSGNNGNWVVTYNPQGGGNDYNDIGVQGDRPRADDIDFF